MSTMGQDIRHAVRVLRKSLLFSAAAAGTMALGIGAATAIFAFLNGVLLQPLPYPEPSRLVLLWETSERMQQIIGYREIPASPALALTWRDRSRSLECAGFFRGVSQNFSGHGEAERLRGARVTAGVFQALRVPPLLGRVTTEAEEREGRDAVIVLSHRLWKTRFHAAPDIVGRQIRVDDRQLTVLGVMPEGFNFPRGSEHPMEARVPEETQFWRPLAFSPADRNNTGDHSLSAVARLKPGITPRQARDELASLTQAVYSQVSPEAVKEFQVSVSPYQDQMVQRVRPALLMLGVAVLLLLLIACVNVAGLLLVQSVARRKEMAVRAAVGAGPGRLARQVVLESLLLGLLGGAGGSLPAVWGVHVMRGLAGPRMPRVDSIAVDPLALAFTIVISLATACLFGLAPALSAARVDLVDALKDGSRTTGSRAHNRLRAALVVAEIALSMVLLSGAGLLLRSFWQLLQSERGFQITRVLTMKIPLPSYRYSTPAQRQNFFHELLRNVENLPQVESAGLVNQLPLTGEGNIHTVRVEGRAARPAEEPIAEVREATPGYFTTLRTPLRRGRWLTAADAKADATVAVVNETMARRYWPGEDALGKRFSLGERAGAPLFTVVGISADARQARLDKTPYPQFYMPFERGNSSEMALAVRTRTTPESLAAAIRAEIRRLDPAQPVVQLKTLEQILDEGVAERKLQTLVLSIFAFFALLLAAVGLHGVIAYAAAQRTREFGIRLALGARKQQILGAVMGQGMKVAAAGVLAGLVCSLAAARLLSGFLYGVRPADPATLVTVAALFLSSALAATLAPAWRALRVDPVRALHDE